MPDWIDLDKLCPPAQRAEYARLADELEPIVRELSHLVAPMQAAWIASGALCDFEGRKREAVNEATGFGRFEDMLTLAQGFLQDVTETR